MGIGNGEVHTNHASLALTDDVKRIEPEFVSQFSQIPDALRAKPAAFIELLKISSLLGLTVSPPVVQDHLVAVLYERRVDILPHPGAAKSVMEEHNGIAATVNLAIDLFPMYRFKGH